ncbi:MAG: bile acid:sodium symporter [Planctomycetes bacterium]|nr:bile acid:sodium symporter [Planctomycetota bacterium]
MLASLFGRRFWITSLLMIAAGMWLPGDYSALRPMVGVALGGILFFTGLKMRVSALVDEVRDPPGMARVATLAAIKLLLVPAVACAVAWLFGPQWALGVLLVSAMPAGMSSTAIADVYRASGPLALVVTLATCLACPLTVPLVLRLGAGSSAMDAGALGEQALYIATMLIVPFTLAQVVRRTAPAFVDRHQSRWGYGAVISSASLIFFSISASRQAWAGFRLVELLSPLLIDTAVMATTLAIGLSTRRWLGRQRADAFTFCCVWMNNGLAVAFAGQFYHGDPYAILPPVLMQLPITGAVAVMAWVIARDERSAAAANGNGGGEAPPPLSSCS